ncbi:MAG: DUF411 domain-containing protein [Sphingomonas bacterium]|nr:DUF411 domain-containing protein [Sphingomonas bacterium]
MNIGRRALLAIGVPLAIFSFAAPAAAAVINVVKTASCGCCSKWVDHLRKAGHDMRVTNVEDVGPTARRLGVPDDLRSCHSASVGKYAFEGHVPAADIARLLKEKPAAAGLAVPGMAAGSPGMEVAGQHPRYQTILFMRDGKRKVFAQH